MYKTKEQLYNELKELTEENRKQIKEILDDIVESDILSAHLINIPKCLDLFNQYNISPKELNDCLDDYLKFDLEAFCDYCDWLGVFTHITFLSDSNFFDSFKITICPETENTFLDDLFPFRQSSYTEDLKQFIEDYVDHADSFTGYLCDNCFIATDIYSEDFYELATVKLIWASLDKYQKFFNSEIEKLKVIRNDLYECGDRINETFGKFEQRFTKHLGNIGFERKH
jgi:hypothetical protein